jgi:flagellar biogenesis protein FliO
MTNNQRLGLLALVVVVAVGAFVIVRPGSEDDAKNTTVQKVQIKDGKPVGGVQSLKFKKGGEAEIVVSVDKEHALHLHGYDIEKTATPSRPATFKFKASNEGQFELESHTNEHAGLEPVVARVLVEPS